MDDNEKRLGARDRRLQRQQEADDRHAERSIRSPQEQLAELDKRGCVATKERAKLKVQMEKAA